MSTTVSQDTMTLTEAAEEVLTLHGNRLMTTQEIAAEIEDTNIFDFETDQPVQSLNTVLVAHSDKPYPSSPDAPDTFQRVPQGKKSRGRDQFRLMR